jgi:hypothetical protein
LIGFASAGVGAVVACGNSLSALGLHSFGQSANWLCFFGVSPAVHFHNPLSKFKLGAFRTSRKLPLFSFVFAASEAAIHFPNPLSQLNLGAFQTSHKLGLFVQVGMISFEF